MCVWQKCYWGPLLLIMGLPVATTTNGMVTVQWVCVGVYMDIIDWYSMAQGFALPPEDLLQRLVIQYHKLVSIWPWGEGIYDLVLAVASSGPWICQTNMSGLTSGGVWGSTSLVCLLNCSLSSSSSADKYGNLWTKQLRQVWVAALWNTPGCVLNIFPHPNSL